MARRFCALPHRLETLDLDRPLLDYQSSSNHVHSAHVLNFPLWGGWERDLDRLVQRKRLSDSLIRERDLLGACLIRLPGHDVVAGVSVRNLDRVRREYAIVYRQ